MPSRVPGQRPYLAYAAPLPAPALPRPDRGFVAAIRAASQHRGMTHAAPNVPFIPFGGVSVPPGRLTALKVLSVPGRLVSNLVSAAINGVTAANRAMQGEFGDPRDIRSFNERAIPAATDMAGMLGLSAPAALARKNAVGIFGGRLAQTADKDALARAEAMEEAGAAADDIWQETGWGRGADKDWRFEIDDSTARIGDKALSELTAHGSSGDGYGATQRVAAGVLWHDDLYAAYPELRQIDVDARYNAELRGGGGYFNVPENSGGRPEIHVESSELTGGRDSVRSVLLHELQHGVQRLEGTARGGSPRDKSLGPEAQEVKQAAEREYFALSDEMHAFLDANIKTRQPQEAVDLRLQWERQNPEKAARREEAWKLTRLYGAGPQVGYRHLAGEVEARNVQIRAGLTAEQRRAIPPWKTEDIARQLQIIRRRGASEADIQASIRAYHGSPHDFDQFDMGKIGSGEGAQVYGHGLYFAQNPKVAETYKYVHGGGIPTADVVTYQGKEIGNLAGIGRAALRPAGAADPGMSDGLRGVPPGGTGANVPNFGVGATPAKLRDVLPDYSDDQIFALQALILSQGDAAKAVAFLAAKGRPEAARIAEETAGEFSIGKMNGPEGSRMYEVEIDAEPDQFLDWDKPLSEQPEPVKQAIGPQDKPDKRLGATYYVDAGLGRGAYGREAYAKAATEAVREKGIPGIRYLDQGSRVDPAELSLLKAEIETHRATGNAAKLKDAETRLADAERRQANQSHNYVVFDDALVRILRKYAILGAAGPAAALAVANSDDAQAAQRQRYRTGTRF